MYLTRWISFICSIIYGIIAEILIFKKCQQTFIDTDFTQCPRQMLTHACMWLCCLATWMFWSKCHTELVDCHCRPSCLHCISCGISMLQDSIQCWAKPLLVMPNIPGPNAEASQLLTSVATCQFRSILITFSAQEIVKWVNTADGCILTANMTLKSNLLFCKFVHSSRL